MPVNLKFYYFSEKKPKHEECIIYMEPVSTFGFMGFEPRMTDIIYDWEEIDENGHSTGNQMGYTEGDEQQEGWRLKLMVSGGSYVEDNWLWMPEEDFFKSVNGESNETD